jgi:energy-coupling factor transporter ATP-binding protein EcfA2
MSNLALDLRPQNLDQVLGQEAAKKAIKSFAEKDNWPNVFLFYGPPGTGKTTLALIVAQLAGAEGDGLHEINASTDNGVDFARSLAEISSSRPFSGRRRVIVLNEFHQVTVAAQNALKDPMEKNPALWILTTDKPEKVEPAIKSRAAAATFELKPLSDADRAKLVVKALAGKVSVEDGSTVLKFLHDHEVNAPREILGVLDQYLSGVLLEEAIHGSEHEPLYPEVAKAVLAGNWTKTASLLKKIPTADYRAMVAVVSAKLRWALLDSEPGPRADGIAACLVGIGDAGFADGTAYASLTGLLYKTSKVMSR